MPPDEDWNEPPNLNNSKPLVRSYWDTNMNDTLIDDSWTMESEVRTYCYFIE